MRASLPHPAAARPGTQASPAQTAAPQHVASSAPGNGARSANGSNGNHPAATNGASPGAGKRSAAPPKKRVISARTRNILPKELRPRGMIVPRF